MKCSNCGNENMVGATTCWLCGSSLGGEAPKKEEPTPQATPQSNYGYTPAPEAAPDQQVAPQAQPVYEPTPSYPEEPAPQAAPQSNDGYTPAPEAAPEQQAQSEQREGMDWKRPFAYIALPHAIFSLLFTFLGFVEPALSSSVGLPQVYTGYSLTFAIIALTAGIIGKGNKKRRGLGTAGLVLSIIAFVLAFLFLFLAIMREYF